MEQSCAGEWDFLPVFILRSAGFPVDLLEELHRAGAKQKGHAPRAPATKKTAEPATGGKRQDTPGGEDGNREHEYSYRLRQERQALQGILREDPRVLEAIWLQSHQAYRAVQRFARAEVTGARTGREARQERLSLKYLQRLCAKNDSHSFFGPTACGKVLRGRDTSESCCYVPGSGLIAERLVFFTHWAARALADAIRVEDKTGPFRRVRLASGMLVCVDEAGGEFQCLSESSKQRRQFAYRRGKLGLWFAILLRLCERSMDWEQFIRGLSRLGIPSEGAQELLEAGLIEPEFLVPAGLFHPLQYIQARLEEHPDPVFAGRWRGVLSHMDERRQQMARASFQRRRAIQLELEEVFTQVTGESAQRGAGEFYQDRFIVFERAGRNLEACSARAEMLDRFIPVLSWLGNWAWCELSLVRTRYRRWFASRYGEGESIPLVEVFGHARQWEEECSGESCEEEALRRRLEELSVLIQQRVEVCVRDGGSEVELSLDSLVPHVQPAGAPPESRYLSADLMIARSGDVERMVLGEIHEKMGVMDDVPRLEAREAHLEAVSGALARLAPPGHVPVDTVLIHQTSLDCREADLGLSDLLVSGHSPLPPERVIRAREVHVVLDRGKGFRLRTFSPPRFLAPIGMYERQGAWNYVSPVVGLCWPAGFWRAVRPQSSSPRNGFFPRVSVEGVVVARARWVIPRERLAAGLGARRQFHSSFANFKALQKWRGEEGVPRHVFLRVGPRMKPVYLELDSPLFSEVLFSMLRKTKGKLELEEMLPGPDEVILRDDAGQSYTSEMRFCFVSPGRDCID